MHNGNKIKNDLSFLGLITARGGSKGVPRKNVREVGGKPLIAWTIEVAVRSHLDRVIVSTDNEEISMVSKSWGAEVPFKRPEPLAQDDSSHLSVLVHAIHWLNENEGYIPDYIMLLQPTSPLRSVYDVNHSIGMAIKKNADSVISVKKTKSHPYITKQISQDGKLKDFIEKPEGYLSRQSLPLVYVINGAIYAAKRETLLKKKDWYSDNTYAYVMPPERSLDIDTPWDLYLADLILKDKQENEGN